MMNSLRIGETNRTTDHVIDEIRTTLCGMDDAKVSRSSKECTEKRSNGYIELSITLSDIFHPPLHCH